MALPGQLHNKVPADKEDDAEFMESVGIVATNNNTGCMFLQIDGYVTDWIKEWKSDGNPLLDLGCAYGIHSIHAMKQGCDVISVDMDEVHIKKLQEEATSLDNNAGNLVSAHVQRLPVPNGVSLLEEGSVSAVLLSEVFHFLQVGEPLRIMKHVYNWLVPGGRVFVSTGSPKGFDNIFAHGAKMNGGQTESEVMTVVHRCTDEEIIAIGPSFTTFAESSALKTLYYMTTKELGALARLAGFDVERLEYYSPRKYQVLYTQREESVLLVARKPEQY